MAATRPRYNKEEFAQRGDAIYERDLRPRLEAGNGRQYSAGLVFRFTRPYTQEVSLP
jgi:hypothetical protein